MSDDAIQQSLFDAFTPEAGVHKGPPDVVFERSHRAHQYRLTLRRDGVAVATIPARGTEREAQRFVEQHRDWIAALLQYYYDPMYAYQRESRAGRTAFQGSFDQVLSYLREGAGLSSCQS